MTSSNTRSYRTRREFLMLGGATVAVVLSQACSQPSAPAAKPTAAPAVQVAPTTPPQVPKSALQQATAAPAGQAAPVATQAAAAAPAKPTAAPAPANVRRGGTLTVAKPSPMREFDPFQVSPGHYTWMRAIWNSPVHYDAALTPQPELAESWQFSPDNLEMTLRLRKGVKFHSGREFVSEDVKFTVNFAASNDKASLRSAYQTIKEVKTPDPHTAILRFDKINPGVFDILDTLYIMDRDTIDQIGKTAIGTGPFKLDRYVPNDRVEMSAFKEYWEPGKPYVDKFVVRQIPDLSAMAINLESGEVDAVWQVNFPDLVRLRDSGKFVADLGAPGAFKFAFELNLKREPLQNKKVRQALAWAVDRKRFTETGLYSLVEPTPLLWPEHSWAYFKDLESRIGFDLERSKALLAEAGFANGFDLEILGSSAIGPGHGALLQVIQSDLKKIGINARINEMDPAQVSDRLEKADMMSTVHTFGRGNRDPGSVFAGTKSLYSAKEGGWTNIENDEYDKLRADLQSTLDRDARQKICRRIQEIMLDECFNNPVAYQPRSWVLAPYVKGLTYNMDNTPYVSDMWLDK
ncbi:MAG: ABC transporter substrate-binding protein [Chloroflexi bacterium]|nr:ABC transporter substrate-binding protein [Chloroflexota bacterium]